MPTKLNTYTLQIGEDNHVVEPKGQFSINVEKQGSYYRYVFNGVMTFTRNDYDLLRYTWEEDECVKIYIYADFRGTKWTGYFTKADCTIHQSKRFIDVTPHTEDYYNRILPYMNQEFNILPDYKGYKALESVEAVRVFPRERITAEIKTPYLGYANWKGYSVNDWIHGTSSQGYYGASKERNSLIHELFKYRTGTERTFSFLVDYHNQPLYLDYVGIRKYLTEDTVLAGAYRDLFNMDNTVPECYTLVKVINHFDKDKNFERCELIYEREVWENRSFPPGAAMVIDGKNCGYINPASKKIFELLNQSNQTIEQIYDTVFPRQPRYNDYGGWHYDHNNKKWYRRPLNIFDFNKGVPTGTWANRLNKYGDGTWYSTLSDYIETSAGYINYQVLNNNRNYPTEADMYATEYGNMEIKNRFHKVTDIIEKFRANVAAQIGEVDQVQSINSQYLTAIDSPLPWIPYDLNEWRDVAIIQNSDARRPESTEKATEEIFTFQEFMDMICTLSNAGWAIDHQGVMTIEHVFFFENGFSYDVPIDPDWILNPRSIKNTALNRSFLRLSDVYSYDRPDMQKYEVFSMLGGSVPEYDKTQIVYDTPCANNLPDENTKEISIERGVLDYMWLLSEGQDAGVTFVKLNGDEIPFLLDSDNLYKINAQFTLEDIVKRYHNYGRSFKTGYVNSEETLFITRPYIIHNIFFPYRYIETSHGIVTSMWPYMKVVTDLGYGNVKQAVFNSMTGMLDLTLGYMEGTVGEPEIPSFDGTLPDKSSGICSVQFHRHVQTTESTLWTVTHRFGTDAIYKPLVFDEDFNEIGYAELTKLTDNALSMRFTQPVKGEAYFLSFDYCGQDEDVDVDFPIHHYIQEEPSATWDITHNIGVKEIRHSIVWRDNKEINIDDFILIDEDNSRLTFSRPVIGEVYLSFVNLYEDHVEMDGTAEGESNRLQVGVEQYKYPLKPLVMYMDSQIGYDYSILEAYLYKIGFSKAVIATIIVKQHD